MEFGFKPASNQLRTSSEPASVREFGFKMDQQLLIDCATKQWCKFLSILQPAFLHEADI